MDDHHFTVGKACRESWDELVPQVESGIGKFRQNDFNLQIRDLYGQPVEGAEVRVEQVRSAFDFGCNCLWLGQLGAKNLRYEELLTDLFNLVTTTFCLGDMQPEPGVWRFSDTSPEIFRRPPVDRVIDFAKRNHLRLKGQPLMAGSWYPKWACEKNLDEAGIKSLYVDYFKRVEERCGKEFDCFDLVNEMFCHTTFPLYTENVEYVDWAFRTARKIFPADGPKLYINEATKHAWGTPISSGENRYYNLLRRLIDTDNAPDAFGCQFHLWGEQDNLIRDTGEFALARLYKQAMAYSELGLPMYISEITIVSRSCTSGELNEELQAEILEKCYRMFYSIPNMRGILQWNLCDGRAWGNEGSGRGGLVDEFLRKKKAYLALENLLKREWRTAFDSVTGTDGNIAFRGFSGNYAVTVVKASQKRTFNVDSFDPNPTLILV